MISPQDGSDDHLHYPWQDAYAWYGSYKNHKNILRRTTRENSSDRHSYPRKPGLFAMQKLALAYPLGEEPKLAESK